MADHGRPSTYNSGCRCEVCRTANKERCARIRANLIERRKANPAAVPHSLSGYVNWGCRCEICKAALVEYNDGDWDISRTNEPWSGDDLAAIQRGDIPVYRIARGLKRSYNSVVKKRYQLRQEAAANGEVSV